MVKDALLKDVHKAFESLAAEHLRPFLRALKGDLSAQKKEAASPVLRALKEEAASPVVETIVRQLLRLQWRSQHVMREFSVFHCVRLLLDEQSPLATFFIDLFCQLECLLHDLYAACLMQPLKTLHIHFPDKMVLLPLLELVRPVASTCRLLYVAYMILPRCKAIQDLEEQLKFWRDEVKLKGRHGRQFLRNPAHSWNRKMGLRNLDELGFFTRSTIKLTEPRGEGAFATVYMGVVESYHGNSKGIIRSPLAVKMFSSSSSNVNGGGPNSNFGIRLVQSMDRQPDNPLRDELHRLVSVKHPNVVTCEGYIGKRPEGDGGLVMELMDESLHDYLVKVNNGSVPRLQELDMLDLMLEIAKGMRFLHECNLIHRDLKPQNVLLRFCADHEDLGCKLLEVKLADFGLTKLLDQFDEGGTVSRHTTMRGTSCYMAPELRCDSTHEELALPEKVDVFSFGTTCFNILIGNPDACAFSKTRGAFYEAVRTGKWKEWMQGHIGKHLQYLVKLIGKCWETDPTMRPTFATLCLLLQHAMQCHVSDQSLFDALGAAQAISTAQALSNLQVFKRCKLEHAEFYVPTISDYLLKYSSSVIGLRVVTNCLLEFKSAIETFVSSPDSKMKEILLGMAPVEVAKQILLSGLVCNKDDTAEIPDMNLMKAVEDSVSMGRLACAAAASTSEMMERCLEKPDPLIFMKGLPCHKLAERYAFDNDSKEFKLPPAYEEPEVDWPVGHGFYSELVIEMSKLVVDMSLIPLLLAFWTNPYSVAPLF